MRKSLRIRLTVYFIALVFIPLILVGVIGTWQSYNIQASQALDAQSQVAKRVAEQVNTFIQERENELLALADVRGLSNATRKEQNNLLSKLFSTKNVYEELILLNAQGKEQIFLSRVDIITAQNLSSRVGSLEFEKPKETGETYYSAVSFDEYTGEPFMIMSIPLVDLQTGHLTYVLAAKFRIKAVWDIMAEADVIGNGVVYMIDNTNYVIAHANPSIVLQGTSVDIPKENSFTTGQSGNAVAMARESIALHEQTFHIIAEQPASEALSSALNNIYLTTGITLVAMLVAGYLGILAARQITTPIGELAETAQLISEGDLSREPTVDRQDEIGAMAAAFNTMTEQIRNMFATLEQRVADRTKALVTSAEVTRRLATILDPEQLASEVVNEVRTAFDYYHAQIYLLDDDGHNAVLASGTGKAGEKMLEGGHSIPVGRGLVGRAAETNTSVLIPDVYQEEDWLPNDFLPETKSEAAIPISIGNQVLGVLDVQHTLINGLTEEDVTLLESLAGQVAISLQNTRIYVQSRSQVELESLVNVIGQKIQRATTVEDTLKIAIRELGTVIGGSRVRASLNPATGSEADESQPSADAILAKIEADESPPDLKTTPAD